MGMNRRATTAGNLQRAINAHLVTVKTAKVESKEIDHDARTITAERFKNDLDFYMESGIFADSLDFTYELRGKDLTINAGNMSCYCEVCITVELTVNNNVNMEDLENMLRKVEED